MEDASMNPDILAFLKHGGAAIALLAKVRANMPDAHPLAPEVDALLGVGTKTVNCHLAPAIAEDGGTRWQSYGTQQEAAVACWAWEKERTNALQTAQAAGGKRSPR
jgi:hypothetical protein